MLGEIIGFQYKISEITLKYISDIIIPYYADINPDLADLYPQFFDISQTIGVLFVITFILSFISFILGRLVGRLLKFQAYDAEKYRVVLVLNIFYIVPFIYGFIGGRIKIINIILLLIGSGVYYVFKWLFSNPNTVIKYFM